jgi:CBS domain containing-hemolysin-like protein
LSHLERLPAEGDEVQFGNYRLIVEKMSERKIETIRFYHEHL